MRAHPPQSKCQSDSRKNGKSSPVIYDEQVVLVPQSRKMHGGSTVNVSAQQTLVYWQLEDPGSSRIRLDEVHGRLDHSNGKRNTDLSES
mmetsp:Transcript_4308/g.12385  ORF Transcript_4308/g.12385 Transcript_4308/m.12385 type:complete len:89 (+) Transcript_4308:1664-1930(+)